MDKVLDPVFEVAPDVAVALVEIWESCESAVLNLVLVIPVVDLTVGMVVLRLVEWVNLAKVITNRCRVVGDDIHHHGNALAMGSVDERLEICIRTEVSVSFLPVLGPVAVVPWVKVINDWGDPDGIEAKSLNIVKVVLDTLPGSTTVVAEVCACSATIRVFGEPVGDDLVNRLRLPEIFTTSLS